MALCVTVNAIFGGLQCEYIIFGVPSYQKQPAALILWLAGEASHDLMARVRGENIILFELLLCNQLFRL